MAAEEGLRDLDSEVERDIRAELRQQRLAGRGPIDVTVESGLALLAGFVESYAEKWAIERAVMRIVGVRAVRDHLEVRPPKMEQRSDAQIAAAARCALEWDTRVPASVGAEVTDGVLRLDGTVTRYAEREAAEEAIRNLVGLRDVLNEIRLAPSGGARDVAGDIEAAIRRRFGVACRQVWIIERNGIVTVSGQVATLELLAELERVIERVDGVAHVDNCLLVA